MNVLEKVFNRFNGLRYRQEYLCMPGQPFGSPLHVYLKSDGLIVNDLTDVHSFIGYCPLVFAFPQAQIPHGHQEIELVFSEHSLKQNVLFSEKDAVASLRLRVISKNFGNSSLVLYEGVYGNHRFQRKFHQWILQQNYRLNGKKKDNVFLEGNLYKQVQIAYSVPRKICLITVGAEGFFNLFPTDLHGQAGDETYLISLRHRGLACMQVEQFKKIVLSDIDASAYKKVYSLGKNHMQPLRSQKDFDFSGNVSPLFNLPLPAASVAYRELELIESVQHGIHRFLLFRIVSNIQLGEGKLLVHIHNTYATWRDKQGWKGNYLMR